MKRQTEHGEAFDFDGESDFFDGEILDVEMINEAMTTKEEWHHIAKSKDESGVSVYIDGELVEEKNV